MSVVLDGSLRLLPTSARHHLRPGVPYVVAVAPSVARRLGPAGMGVLERDLPGAPSPLAVIVRVLSDATCEVNDLRVDQTVRTALGLPLRLEAPAVTSEHLRLHRVETGWGDRARNAISGLFGRRYVLLRAAPPRPADIEKRVCRMTADDLVAVGSSNGRRIVLFGARPRPGGGYELGRASLQALALDREAERERLEDEQRCAEEGWGARYVCPKATLGVEGSDLPKLFIDKDVREEIGVYQAAPVLVRRNARSAFSHEIQDFGIALLASFLALDGVVAPVLAERGWSVVARGVIVLFTALLMAVGVVVLRLRADLR